MEVRWSQLRRLALRFDTEITRDLSVPTDFIELDESKLEQIDIHTEMNALFQNEQG